MLISLIKKSSRFIPAIFYLLLAVFLGLYLKSIDYSQFKEAEFAWSFILIASLLGLATRFLQIFIWFVLLKGLGAKDLNSNIPSLIYVYAKSWMGRYIPGTAPWILGKIYFASKHGISKNKLAVSSLLEGGLQIAVVMAVSFLMLFSDSRLDVIDTQLKVLMGVVLAGCIIAILPPIFNKIIASTYRILKRKTLGQEHYASSSTVLRGVALYAFGALLNGLSLFFIAKAIYPDLSASNAFFVMGVGNLAGAVGMLAVFAPSGIGVREGIQLALLSLIMPTELALLVTVSTRLWGVAMDVLFFGIAKAIHTLQK